MYPPAKLRTDIYSLLEMSFFMGIVINAVFSYGVVYFLVPKYFNQKKYFQFATGLLLLEIIIQFIAAFHKIIEINVTAHNVIGVSPSISFAAFKAGFIRLFGNPPLICGLLLSLKTLKNWHLEQLRSETLAKETTNAELQLLKAQVHPHFLFNTLNNIYSFTLTHSPLAGKLVQKLSDMLNYMIYECKEPLVPLKKEIKLIGDYMGVEKVRYGNRLAMQVEVKGNQENIQVAPLLMIPFVENCFKHGSSAMRGKQWIRLHISIEEDQLDFKLSNSKPPDLNDTNNKKGIGLANVQKRLQLIYPGKHFLKTESTSDSYTVHLQVSLQQFPLAGHTKKTLSKLQSI